MHITLKDKVSYSHKKIYELGSSKIYMSTVIHNHYLDILGFVRMNRFKNGSINKTFLKKFYAWN